MVIRKLGNAIQQKHHFEQSQISIVYKVVRLIHCSVNS